MTPRDQEKQAELLEAIRELTQPPKTLPQWGLLVANLGVPTVLVLWFTWYMATPLVTSHIELMNKVCRNDDRQTAILDLMQKENAIKIEILQQSRETIRHNENVLAEVKNASASTAEMMNKAMVMMEPVPRMRQEQLELSKQQNILLEDIAKKLGNKTNSSTP